jgi:hypothetical protein
MQFRTTVLQAGKTATGIQVPDEVVTALGSGKRPAVSVTINGYAYRSTVAPMDGVYMLPISAERRAAAGIAAGDVIDVDIQLDTEPREVAVPPDFAEALNQHDEARRFFDGLSYSGKLRHVLSIEDAKTPETRRRRIDKAVETLQAGRK